MTRSGLHQRLVGLVSIALWLGAAADSDAQGLFGRFGRGRSGNLGTPYGPSTPTTGGWVVVSPSSSVARGPLVYQLPTEYSGAPTGSVIRYGGANYISNGDGTMSPYFVGAQGATAQPRLTAPIAGQRYRVPTELSGTVPGTVITYGGRRYTMGSDGTMTYSPDATLTDIKVQPAVVFTEVSPGQRFRVPTEYAATPAGQFISYLGRNYLVGNDGMMTYFSGPIPGTEKNGGVPVPGQRYSIPPEFVKAAAGSVVTYNEYTYVVGTGGTMTCIAKVNPSDTAPVPGKRYAIPTELGKSPAGTVVIYKNHSYVIGNDGMMTSIADSPR